MEGEASKTVDSGVVGVDDGVWCVYSFSTEGGVTLIEVVVVILAAGELLLL